MPRTLVKKVKKSAAAAPTVAKAKKPAAAGKGASSVAKKNPMFVARKKNFSIGQDRMHRRNLGTCVKFPRYVILQRRTKSIKTRLQQPPQIQQFSKYCDKHTKSMIADFLRKNAPETKLQKKLRLKSTIKNEIKTADEKVTKKSKIPAGPESCVKFGVQNVTRKILKKEAKLVIIAANVDPLQQVMFLPSLCIHHEVPYVIVPDMGWLGKQIGQKRVTCIALVEPQSDQKTVLKNIADVCKTNYNEVYNTTRTEWGESHLSKRAQRHKEKKENLIKMNAEKSSKLVI